MLPALQLEGDACANFLFFFYITLFVFRSSVGKCLRQIGIDCNITLEKSQFSMVKQRSVVRRSILRFIFELLNFFSHLLSFHRFIFDLHRGERLTHIFLFLSPLLDSLDLLNIDGFENTIVGPFLTTLSSQLESQVLRRILFNTGELSVDIFLKIYYPLQAAPISRAS